MGRPVRKGGETRTRLLNAAGAVFAQHGYQGATIRQICSRARANVSAVAYHFGSKEALYEQALRHSGRYAAERFPLENLGELASQDPEAALARFVETLLRRLLDRGRPAWHGRLMAREMAEPTKAFRVVVDEVVRPMFDALSEIVSHLCDAPLDADRTWLCVASIFGQCTFHRNARSLSAALRPDAPYDDIDRLTDHITQFSLQGLRRPSPGQNR